MGKFRWGSIMVLGVVFGVWFQKKYVSLEPKKVEQISFGNVLCREIVLGEYNVQKFCEFKTKSHRFCLLSSGTNQQTTIDCKIFDDLGK